MAATGYTPISLYYSATAAAVPTAGNLVPGELALNTNDGKLYYEDSAGAVQVIGTKGGVGSSTTTQVLYNSSGLVVGSANLTFNGTTLTAGGLSSPTLTNAGTLALSATSTNIITASTNGSERMRIDSSGNVGVGTSTPTSFGGSLVVYAASNPISVIASGSANAYLRLYSTSDNNMYLANLGGSMAMLTANAERIRIDSSGNLLIGTSTSPAGSKELVLGGDYIEAVVAIGNSGTTQTLALTNGTFQTVTLTGNCTFTMPTAIAGKSFILILVQDGTGGRTAVFTSVEWPSGTAPTISTTATTGRDIITFLSDGTYWYGAAVQNFS